jgi:uncharacterized membrane protein (GlpM family)
MAGSGVGGSVILPDGLRYNRLVSSFLLPLKLVLVPMFLLAVSLAARRWGPHVAGRLAGMPVVVGPILAFIAVEQGPAFGAQAAAGSLASVPGVLLFLVVYARAALRTAWPAALGLALAAWAATSWLVLQGPRGLAWLSGLAALSLAVAPRLAPRVAAPVAARPSDAADLALRMAAGAALTLAVTLAAATMGGRVSGLLAAFPLLSTVVSVTTHRRQGGPYIAALLRAMLSGLYAMAAFCAALALALPRLPLAAALGVAVGAAMAMQVVTGRVGARQRRFQGGH